MWSACVVSDDTGNPVDIRLTKSEAEAGLAAIGIISRFAIMNEYSKIQLLCIVKLT
jgi:hypothetical protein